MPDSLGDRMKSYYEDSYRIKLPMRMPLIIRLDGKAFHSLTRNCTKPFDNNLIDLMNETALVLCEEIQGAVLAYIQSDEISILVHNYKRLESSAWFDNNLQKIVSVSAGIASANFTATYNESSIAYRNHRDVLKTVVFDSRAFVIPEAEVCNYFIWRQKDWERNSIQMLARSLYSHKELHKKNVSELNEMCYQKGKNWNDLNIHLKRGRCCVYDNKVIEFFENNKREWRIDNEIPIFTENRNYINNLLNTEENNNGNN